MGLTTSGAACARGEMFLPTEATTGVQLLPSSGRSQYRILTVETRQTRWTGENLKQMYIFPCVNYCGPVISIWSLLCLHCAYAEYSFCIFKIYACKKLRLCKMCKELYVHFLILWWDIKKVEQVVENALLLHLFRASWFKTTASFRNALFPSYPRGNVTKTKKISIYSLDHLLS